MAILGLDIGASKVYFVALEGSERVAEGVFENSPPTTQKLIETCGKIKTELDSKKIKVDKIGIGAPGLPKDGTLGFAPNFVELVEYPLAEKVRKVFGGVPAVIHNDANAFTYAETAMGAASQLKNVIGLTLGSGLGGGLVINGQLYVGKGGAEIGHTIMNLRGDEEAEDLASAKFFKKRGKDPKGVRERAEAGDGQAKKIWEEFGKNLGYVIANLVNTLDPEAVVLGGGIADGYDLFIEEAQRAAGEHIVNPASKKVPILKSVLGPAGGAIGAALLAG